MDCFNKFINCHNIENDGFNRHFVGHFPVFIGAIVVFDDGFDFVFVLVDFVVILFLFKLNF